MKDAVVSATRKARAEYAKTEAGQYDELLKLEIRWKRKETISRTKLAEVRNQLTKLGWNAIQGRKCIHKWEGA